MIGRALALALAWALLAAAPAVASVGPTAEEDGTLDAAATHGDARSFTYDVTSEGQVASDPAAFARTAGGILDDRRGWSLGGSVSFSRVDSGGDFTLILASPQAVAEAHSVCSAEYSCRVGDRIYVNDDNWRHATSAWREAGGDLSTYREYLVNHEVGHYLGFGHHDCPGTDRPAPVMQQQSISLDGCEPTGWPSSRERAQLGERLGVPVIPVYDWIEGDVTGDGRLDVIGFSSDTGEWVVGANSQDRFEFATWGQFRTRDGWQTHLAADVTGDGVDEILSYHPATGAWYVGHSDGGSFTHERWARFATSTGWAEHVAGDFTGDGAHEVASYHPSNGSWWVTGADDGTQRWARFATRTGWQTHLAGDVTGNGADDLVSYHPRGVLWVSASDGTGFDGSRWASYRTGAGWQTHLLADVTGDGREDVASFHPSNGTWWLARSTGNTFEPTRWARYATGTGWQTHLALDATGDGQMDLASYHPSNGTWWVAESGEEQATVRRWATYATPTGWTHLAGAIGAERDGVASFHQGARSWWVGASTGDAFDVGHGGDLD